jgi:glutamine cyclotransferase
VLTACGDDGALPANGATSIAVTTSTASTAPSAPSSTAGEAMGGVERLRVEVVATYPHDPDAFTQGLELDGETLYESTGLYGQSSVRRLDPATGEVLAQYDLDDREFGEGLTVVDDALVVLTWKEGTAHLLDAATLEPQGTFPYDTEGWGICDAATQLVMSDGTSTLYLRDRDTFEEIGRIEVTLEGEPVDQLNELECTADGVYANVWRTDTIVRVDPDTGRVTAVIDASGLLPESQRRDPEAVLNGIAQDLGTGAYLLTGKWWPTLFEVRFVPA